ncbi:HAD family hydrolase [Paenibacillus rhizoplanae]
MSGWNQVISSYKGAATEVTIDNLQGIMGLPVPEVGRKLFPDADEDTRQRIMNDCCEMECEVLSQQGGRLYEQVEEVLQALSAKYKLFIVSNCQAGYIEAFFMSIMGCRSISQTTRIRGEPDYLRERTSGWSWTAII